MIWPRFNTGNYRFHERLIRPATALYVLGEFSSYRTGTTEEFISSQVKDLIRQWKQQPLRYLGAYGLNENGMSQNRESRMASGERCSAQTDFDEAKQRRAGTAYSG
jgi:hypothetical protein